MINLIRKSIIAPKVIYKPFKMPKGFIYNVPTNDNYLLIKATTGDVVGRMRASVQRDSGNMYEQSRRTKVFYIDHLDINCSERRNGWGKYFIDFAKNKSQEMESEGRVSLYSFNPNFPPHIFYRKLGFATKSNKINKKLDECIRNKRFICLQRGLRMYLPIGQNLKKVV